MKKPKPTAREQEIKNLATMAMLEQIRADKELLALKITSGNSKAGTTFGIDNIRTCPGATALCKSLCYVNEGAMNFSPAKLMRARNTQACHNALRLGGPRLLASLLLAEIDRVNVRVIRFHDSGDFFSVPYIQAWVIVAQERPDVTFFGYTRSWRIPALRAALLDFAELPNVKLWLSADADCWLAALVDVQTNFTWRGLAFMQTNDNHADQAIEAILQQLENRRVINFPAHSKTKAKQAAINPKVTRNCPAVTGQIKESRSNPACLQCKLCFN